MFLIMRSIKFNGFWCSLSRKVLDKLHDSSQPTSESGITIDMGYCTILRIYNVHIEYNNLLYKILINKRLLKITYGTNSVPFYMI